MEFLPRQVILPSGDTLTVAMLSNNKEAASEFLTIEQAGYVSTFAGTPCLDIQGCDRTITRQEASQMYDPTDEDQIETVNKIARGDYTQSEIRNQLLLLATIGGRAVAVLNLAYGGWTCNNPNGGESYALNLLEMHVAPDFHKRRIGGTALALAIQAITDNRRYGPQARLTLQVGTHNDTAKSWYSALGIHRTGHDALQEWPQSNLRVPLEERAVDLTTLLSNLNRRYAPELATAQKLL